MSFQTIMIIPNFLQILMPNFGNSIKICSQQIVMKTVESYNLERLIIECINNLFVISSTDVLSYLLLLLHMILSDFLECLDLEIYIKYLINEYKLNAALQNLSISFVVYMEEINLYVINLERFCLVYVVFEKEN